MLAALLCRLRLRFSAFHCRLRLRPPRRYVLSTKETRFLICFGESLLKIYYRKYYHFIKLYQTVSFNKYLILPLSYQDGTTLSNAFLPIFHTPFERCTALMVDLVTYELKNLDTGKLSTLRYGHKIGCASCP